MWLTQNGIHVQYGATKVAEALKIVIHCSVHKQFLRFELDTANIFDYVLRSQQFSNLGAAITVGIRAQPDLAQKIDSIAQVSISYSKHFLAFRRLRNNGQAKDIVLAWYGGN
jgi:hypothetical protein